MPIGVLHRGYLSPTTIRPTQQRIVNVVELEVSVENKDLETEVVFIDLVTTIEAKDLVTEIETEELVVTIDPDLIIDVEEDC